MRALIIKVVLSTEGPYGCSFFCIRKYTAQREESKYGKLVQWTEELRCFAHECKEQGSVIFYSPEDQFCSRPHTACCSTSQCNILYIHIKNIYMQTIKKVNNKRDSLVICWWGKNVHTVLSGVISPERLKRSGPVFLINANDFKWKTGNYSHENKRNGSKCKIIDLSAELKKVACWQRAPNNRLAK